MAGWQDAVAGLQTQIDTINSQISTLSGQEATNSAEITSLQTQVSAIQTQLLSLQQQVLIGDIPASDLAVLGNLSASTVPVQFVSGGDAVINVPATDGVRFTFFAAGHVHVTGEIVVNIWVNDNEVSVARIDGSNQTDAAFALRAECVWDAATSTLLSHGFAIYPNGTLQSISEDVKISLSSPTNFDCKVKGHIEVVPDTSATVTVTEFRVIPN